MFTDPPDPDDPDPLRINTDPPDGPDPPNNTASPPRALSEAPFDGDDDDASPDRRLILPPTDDDDPDDPDIKEIDPDVPSTLSPVEISTDPEVPPDTDDPVRNTIGPDPAGLDDDEDGSVVVMVTPRPPEINTPPA